MRTIKFALIFMMMVSFSSFACEEGVRAVTQLIGHRIDPGDPLSLAHDVKDFTRAVRGTGFIDDGMVYKVSDQVSDYKKNAEVLVLRSGDKGWTKGMVDGVDGDGNVVVKFYEDGQWWNKPVSQGRMSTGIKLVDEEATLMSRGRRVMISRNGGQKTPGYIAGFDRSGKMRVEFFDPIEGNWSFKLVEAKDIDDLVKPLTQHPGLKLSVGEPVEVYSRTDDAYVPGLINRVDETGTVHVQYKLLDGREASKPIAPGVVGDVLRPGLNADELNGVNTVKNVFSKSPTHALYDEGDFMARRSLPNGEKHMLFYNTANDRAYAINQGRLFEGISPKNLPKGKTYTYIIRKDGSMVFGQVEDGWEFGVKHAHLANGDEVYAAGEITIDVTGKFDWNLESGTFTRKLAQSGQTDMTTLKRQVDRVFREEMGTAGRYTDDIILNGDPPNPKQLKSLCQSAEFLKSNKIMCEKLIVANGLDMSSGTIRIPKPKTPAKQEAPTDEKKGVGGFLRKLWN